MIDMSERPPFVRFEVRAVENRQKSIDDGRYIADDVEYVLVTPPGSKDCHEAIATEWIANKSHDVRAGRFKKDWLDAIKESFEAWRKGMELPVNGTPIRGWPLLSPARQEMYSHNNIRTVEDLAALTEEGLKNAGMGSRADKQTAMAWIERNADGGNALKVSALQSENADLKRMIEDLATKVRVLQESQPKRGRPKKDDVFDEEAA